jgi:2-dehydropantoate 2-reductase
LNIGIIGGGAIGLLFGSYLASTYDVTIYTRTTQQADLLNRNGITMINHLGNTSYNRRIKSSPISIGIPYHDVVIVAVKQYVLVEIKQIIQKLRSPTIIFLQNGMGHLNLLQELAKTSTIIIGIVEHGALRESETEVIHTGVGVTKISAFQGDAEESFVLFDSLGFEDFKVIKEEDWYTSMTSKLVINAVINPLTALYQVENGVLLKNDHLFTGMKMLFEEVATVVQIEDEESQWNHVIEVCNKTQYNRSSMLKDLETGRKTEVDAILGYVLDQARIKKRTLPVTSFLYQSILGLEKP